MNVSELSPNVAVLAPYAPNIVITQALADTARDFCRRTTAWRVPVSMLLQAGDEEITPAIPAGSVICNVVEARFAGQPLVNGTLHEVMEVADRSAPAILVQSAPTELLLAPRAHQAGALQAVLALAPGRASNEVGDDIGEEFAEALQYGAAWRALRMVGTEWYAPKEAAAFGSFYAEAMEQARLRADRVTTRRVRVVQYGG